MMRRIRKLNTKTTIDKIRGQLDGITSRNVICSINIVLSQTANDL